MVRTSSTLIDAHRRPSTMAPAPSRSLRSTQLAPDLIDLSSDEESSASEIEAGSNTDDEYATANDTTDYDDSDVEVLLDAIRRITTVETGPNTYGASCIFYSCLSSLKLY